MGLLTGFYEWLLPDVPEPPKPKVTGSEFQIQRPEKCQFVYGEFVRIEPHIVRSETITTSTQTGNTIDNNVLVLQLVWSEGEIESIDELFLDDLEVNSGNFSYEAGTTSNGFDFGGRVVDWVHVLDGAEYNAEVGSTLLPTFKGYGNAYTILMLSYDEALMPTKPRITASGFGKKIRNLQSGLTEYSANPIDVYYDYCTNAHGGRIPTDKFILSNLQDERAFCKTQVTNSDGDEQDLMTFNGIIDGNKRAVDNINEIRKQLRIFMPLIKDKYHVLIERPRPVENFIIDDNNKMSDWKVSNVDSGDLLSKVIVKFNDRAQMGKEAKINYPEDGTDDNTITVTLSGVNNAYEAKQYAYVVYLRSISSRTASGSVNKSAIPYNVGSIIKYTEPRLWMVEKNWLITRKSVKDDVVDFELLEYDESIYPWVAHPIPVYPIANVPSNRLVDKPTNIVKSEIDGDTVITWDSDYADFDLQKIVGGVLTDLGTTSNKFINLGNLPQGNHSVMLRAVNGFNYASDWTEFAFVVNTPAIPTGLTVTDAYIEWGHPNLTDVAEFIIETTELTGNNIVAYSQPPSSNGTQRLEITGIKSGDYDVSVKAKGLNNLLSLPATLTNAQIDGVQGAVNDAVDVAVSGFASDPHTWTALNNFTGGLQKDGVDVLKVGDYGVGSNSKLSDDLNTPINQDGFEKYFTLSNSANNPFNESSHVIDLGDLATGRTAQLLFNFTTNRVAYRNNTTASFSEYAFVENNQTWTGSQNFTGGLLKNGSPVIGLTDLTYNSDESLAIASTTIEQFYKDQQAGLYDDFDQGVGSLAAGFVNSIINQANFLIANNANIDKLKSSAIEVSGSGYALNQNPTWQDSLDGWDFSSRITAVIEPANTSGVVASKNRLKITTSALSGEFDGNLLPVSKEETYTISVWLYQTGTATQYLHVNFKDSSGNRISGTNGGATGWAGLGTYHYWGLVNQASSNSSWVKYEIKIGKNGDATIPTGAVSCQIGMLVNYSGDWANTTVYLQDYRIEKAMGSTSIENGSINTDHLVLSGNGSITFETVGADQAGSAQTAENNAKAYAFPQANAGALASLNTINGTHIDNDSITTPKIATNAITANEIASNAITTNKLSSNAVTADKISSDVAIINKLTANKVFGVDATFAGTVYARNLTGDANEYGIADMGDQTITGTSVWNNIAQVKVDGDSYLKRELIVEPFRVDDGSGCSFELRVQTQPIQSGGVAVETKTFLTNGISGNDIETRQAKIIIENDGLDYWVTVRAKNNVGSITPVTNGSITFRTRPISGTLAIDIL